MFDFSVPLKEKKLTATGVQPDPTQHGPDNKILHVTVGITWLTPIYSRACTTTFLSQ